MAVDQNQAPVVMVIGGMDPSGGAGLCADIQTLARFGCHAAPVTTAVTIQDTVSVSSFAVQDVKTVEAQMRAIMEDLSPVAVKTGMLANSEIIHMVASVLREYPGIKLIVDPVMSSNHLDSLSECSLVKSIKEQLLPITSLITPNVPEAELLAQTGTTVDEYAVGLGAAECMITGTHADTSSVINHYYRQGRKFKEWSWPRLEYDYHGSGCTLAAAIAGALARGMEMVAALEIAQKFVITSLKANYNPGKGQHIPYRLCDDVAVEK